MALLAVLAGIYLLFLFIPYRYKGDHPDLYTVAVNNFFGCNGYISEEQPFNPQIDVLETDRYGRVLFSYDEEYWDMNTNAAPPYKDSDGGTFLSACFVMQKSDGENVYYYADDCDLIFEKSDGTDIAVPPESDLEALKKRNDWDLPPDETKWTQKKIVTRNEGAIPDYEDVLESIVEAYAEGLVAEGGDQSIYRFSRFSTADSFGRELYYVYGLTSDLHGEGISPDSASADFQFAVILTPGMPPDLQKSILLIPNTRGIEPALQQLKADNGWETPLSA